ncbi:YciI family protein [Reichenbachiella agariperforans]|uniref:YciI family protein n=1 Tax=Reichenbachiella agariperforans TaxID=156994 RepID=UPI001C07FD69|nr:YciI family protein [Reichenbachiella agariperforans]MBU2915267.1 GTP cyclohydrolase [Reichenbachiella agariperforans]
MHIISLTYKVPLELVDQHLNEHIDYLSEQYRLGHFHASGRKVPRTGGIILSMLSDKAQLLRIIEQDPFKIHGLADYELTEFVASKTCKELRFLVE